MSFRRIPVDARSLNLMVGGEARPVQEYSGQGDNRQATGNQARDEHGVPLWRVDLFCFHEGALVTVGTKFPCATEPTLELQAPVKVEGLSVAVVGRDQYFTATAVTPAAVKQG